MRQLIGSGTTALGRAGYADRLGEYYTAFFGLSIGIERLAKLILVTDYAISNGGALPQQITVRTFGHDLGRLLQKVDDISAVRGLQEEFPRPADPICNAIIKCLSSFSSASQGRYANFEEIGNPQFDPNLEPVKQWWTEVAEQILDRHFRNKRAQTSAERGARMLSEALKDGAFVFYMDEGGAPMDTVYDSSLRTGQIQIVQKYGRYYTLIIIKWLACIFSKLSKHAAYHQRILAMFGHDEIFMCYRAEDYFLKNRKIWPAA